MSMKLNYSANIYTTKGTSSYLEKPIHHEYYNLQNLDPSIIIAKLDDLNFTSQYGLQGLID